MAPIRMQKGYMDPEEHEEAARRVRFAFLDMVAMIIGMKRDEDHVPFTPEQVKVFKQVISLPFICMPVTCLAHDLH